MKTLRPLEPGELSSSGKNYGYIIPIIDPKNWNKTMNIYEIIGTLPHPERDWSDVVDSVYRAFIGWDGTITPSPNEYYEQRVKILRILQQADKPVPIKKRRMAWVNIYEKDHTIYRSREHADRFCNNDRIACKEIEIEYTEGEGLDG